MMLMHLMMSCKQKNLVVQFNQQNQFIVIANVLYPMAVLVRLVQKVSKVDKVLPVDLDHAVKTDVLVNKVREEKWDQEEKRDLMGHPDQTDQKENQVIADDLVFMDLADVKDQKFRDFRLFFAWKVLRQNHDDR